MYRCLQLASNGKGFVSPNPMVGAVVVHDNKIIGEGYHRQYGESHAEVNAINSVKNKSQLKDSTIYVSLEPCSHYGKTPPCAQLIIDSKISRVVVGCLDPYPAVSGRGIKMLQDSEIDVRVGVLEKEARELNKEFFTAQTKCRPYIYLKWAQTSDGFIDRIRNEKEDPKATPISNDFSRMLVHKKRAEVSAIMIGTNTAIKDNPSLTTRYWYGNDPIRIILDREGRIPADYTVFDKKVRTMVFTEKAPFGEDVIGNLTFINIAFDDQLLHNIFSILRQYHIDSVLVEGGSKLLQSFIDEGLWDETFVEISSLTLEQGVKAPLIDGHVLDEKNWGSSMHVHMGFWDNYKII